MEEFLLPVKSVRFGKLNICLLTSGTDSS